MGFRIGGSESTTNLTEENYNPSVATQGSQAPTASVLAEGPVNITQEVTDLDAIRTAEEISLAAIDAVQDSAGGNSDVASDIAFIGGELGEDAIASNEYISGKVIEGASNFAGDLAIAAGNVISDAFYEVGKSREHALDYSEAITLEALETVESQGVGVVNFASDALYENNKLVDKVTETVTRLGLDSIFAVQESSQAALDAANAAQGQAFEFGNDALDVVSDALQDQTTVTRSVLDLADEVTYRTNSYFLEGLNTVATTVEDLNDSRADESENVLAAVAKLGATVSTGGENLRVEANKIFNLAIIAVLGLITWQALRSR